MREQIGQLAGQPLYRYTLTNRQGLAMTCLNYGCAITKLLTPDRSGHLANIVLGYEQADIYQHNPAYCGVVVGRTGGRIAGAEFTLAGEHCQLGQNHGRHHLHGGSSGFSHKLWDSVERQGAGYQEVEFSYISPAGEEGYPGRLTASVRYRLTDTNQLVIAYQGKSDRTTLFMPTNHTYFNLSGDLQRGIEDHWLQIPASQFIEVDTELIPTGNLLAVNDTVFDFRELRRVGDGLTAATAQIQLARGYDHTFLLDGGPLVLCERQSGRRLQIETEAAAVVVYSGNYLAGAGSFGSVAARDYLGIALEVQNPPDSIHHPHFPSSILPAGTCFTSQTIYSFDTIES